MSGFLISLRFDQSKVTLKKKLFNLFYFRSGICDQFKDCWFGGKEAGRAYAYVDTGPWWNICLWIKVNEHECHHLWQKGKLQAVVSMNIWDQYKIHSDQSDWDGFTLHLDECRKVSANRFISVWSCRRFVPTKENHYTAGDASVWQEEGTDKFFLPKKTAQFKVFSCDAKFSYIQR